MIRPRPYTQGLVQHTPDIYLEELQEQLELRRGVVISLSTIWKALRRTGYTMKKVHVLCIEYGHS